MKPTVKLFVQQFKRNLVKHPAVNHKAIVRNDGAKVPHPQVNFSGKGDEILSDKRNHFIALAPGPYAEAIHDLLIWAMENYPMEEEDGKEEKN